MQGSQELFQQAMNQGHEAAWDLLWDQAAAFYRQALKEIPNHPQALTSLGLALAELHKFREALQCYQQAARLAPEDALPIEKVAQLYEHTGSTKQAAQASMLAAERYLKLQDAPKAVENWLRVTHLDRENLQAHTRLAMVYERLGEKQKAVSEYLFVAHLLQTAQQAEKAEQAVNQALQVWPQNEEALKALALLKESRPIPRPHLPQPTAGPGLFAEARSGSESEDPSAPADQAGPEGDPITQARHLALVALAETLFEDTDEPQEQRGLRHDLHSLTNGEGNAPAYSGRAMYAMHLSLAVDLQSKGQDEQAAEEFERALSLGLSHPAASFSLGAIEAQDEKLDRAAAHLQQSLGHPTFAMAAHLLLGEILEKTDRPAAAAMEYLEALKLADASVAAPEHVEGISQLYGSIIESQRNQTDEEAALRLCANIRELLLQPGWRMNLIETRKRLPSQEGNFHPTPLADILTNSNSSQVIESLTTINELSKQGNLHSAMEEAYYALQHAPSYLPIHLYIADLLIEEGRLPEAITKLTTTARTFGIRGETNRALELYRRIVELSPMDLGVRQQLIEELQAGGQVERALQEYLELGDLYYSLADLQMVRKTYTEALALAEEKQAGTAWRVRILHAIADITIQSLDWRGAMRIFEQIRTLKPDDEKARSHLIELNFRFDQAELALVELDAYIQYMFKTGQKEKVLPFVKKLAEENPDQLPVRYRLAELYRQLGLKKQAVDTFNGVVDALLDAGDQDGAAQAVEKILTLNPPEKSEYLDLLVHLRRKLS